MFAEPKNGGYMKLVDLKAKCYDLIAQREAVSNELMKVNSAVSQCCKKCNELPCICKKEENNDKK